MPHGWFVGCGNMGGAMVAGWVKAGRDLSGLTAISPSGREIPGIAVERTFPEGAPEWVWLGHKPYQIEDIAKRLEGRIDSGTVILSILAGVECDSLRRLFPDVRAIVRLMPNLPVSEGEGVVGIYSADADPGLRAIITDVIGDLGHAAWVERERDLVAISTVAGSGPAYVARFIAALAAEARRLGLSPEMAQAIALETVAGTGVMARDGHEPMDSLAARVASPGGSTEAGLSVLDRADGIDRLIAETVAAAEARTEQMAAAARATNDDD